MNISEKMRMRMLVSGLRDELSKGGIIYVDKIRLVGSRLETTYHAKLYHGIKIHEGYIGGDVIELLTCKDSDFSAKMKEFVDNYGKCVRDCIEHSAKVKVGLCWF